MINCEIAPLSSESHSNKTFGRLNAFTLAEVLITLAIIGVVASLTIPALMQKTQNQEYVTALKKFYGEANQALALTAIDEGTPGKLEASSTDVLASDIMRHFKISKNCGNFGTGDCWAPFNIKYDGTSTYNTNMNISINNWYNFMTLDGMSICLVIEYEDCSYTGYNSNPNSPMHKDCGQVYVDVNGKKGPNRLGRDVFLFEVTSNKTPLLYPYGGKDRGDWKGNGYCQASNHDPDYTCAGRVMDEGWQMNY